MIELQKTVKSLIELQRSYFNTVMNSQGPVAVHPQDHRSYSMLLNKLIKEVNKYSATLSTSLNNISKNLFVSVTPNGPIWFNIYRFGSLGAMLNFLSSDEFVCHYIKSIETPWDDINRAVKKLLLDYSDIQDRLDYNQVGVTAREIYIMLAIKVYDPKIHRSINEKGKTIGPNDAKEMLIAFVEKEIDDKKVNSYIIEAVKLAEPVTHTKEEAKQRTQLLIIAVLNVIEIISNLYISK